MMHDALCPDGEFVDAVLCHKCGLIRRVRADEREKVAQEIEVQSRAFGKDAMAVLVGARVARRTLP